MRTFVCGDTHGTHDLKKVTRWYQKNVDNLTEEDVLIQLGDWGAIWYYPNEFHKWKKDQTLQLQWSKKKFTLLVVPGNHENYELINKLPIVEKFGGKVRELKPVNHYNKDKEYRSIYLLERGEIYTINGKTFLALGGAKSQDMAGRTTGIDWWPDELWTAEQEKNCLDNLDACGWKVDYVVAHTCPSFIAERMLNRLGSPAWGGSNKHGSYYAKSNDPTAKFFQFLIDEGLEFKEWRFGHFHEDIQIENFFCHYFNEPHELVETTEV